MLNYDKLNGAIVSRETLEKIQNDTNVKEFYKYGQTAFLDGWRIVLNDGKTYRVYTGGGKYR